MILLARRVPYFLERINNSEGSRSRKKGFIPRSRPRRVGSGSIANAYTRGDIQFRKLRARKGLARSSSLPRLALTPDRVTTRNE
ncbi:hypothetical protein CGCVW01_v003016 [Colletotrichum viniferum]|nr:hypothetical protein CGCVW01_v003016 [Colletotrichum viniferum]